MLFRSLNEISGEVLLNVNVASVKLRRNVTVTLACVAAVVADV